MNLLKLSLRLLFDNFSNALFLAESFLEGSAVFFASLCSANLLAERLFSLNVGVDCLIKLAFLFLFFFIFVFLLEGCEQHGCEEREEHDVSEDHEEQEEEDGDVVGDLGADAVGAHPLVHSPVPILADDRNEHGGDGVTDIVPIISGEGVVVARGVEVLNGLHTRNQVVILVNEGDVGEELHAEQCKDVHEEEHEKTEIGEAFQTFGGLLQDVLECLPRLGKLHHAEKSEGAEGVESGASVDSRQARDGPIDERDYHDDGIEEVIGIHLVVGEAKADQFENHLDKEDPSEELVKDFKHLGLKIALIVREDGKGARIANNEDENEEVEAHRGHQVVEEPVHRVVVGANASVFLMILFDEVAFVVSHKHFILGRDFVKILFSSVTLVEGGLVQWLRDGVLCKLLLNNKWVWLLLASLRVEVYATIGCFSLLSAELLGCSCSILVLANLREESTTLLVNALAHLLGLLESGRFNVVLLNFDVGTAVGLLLILRVVIRVRGNVGIHGFFEIFSHFLIFFIFVTATERVNDDGKDEVHSEEGADQDHHHEEDDRDDTVTSVVEVVHEVDPTLEGEDLEDGQESLADVVEAGDAVHDQLDVADAIILDRVQSVLFKGRATDVHIYVRE